MNTSRAVIKFGKVWRLVEYVDFRIRHLAILPFSSESVVTTDGYIVAGISGTNLIHLRIDEYISRGELTEIELPEDLIVHFVRITNKRRSSIYIGGKVRGNMLEDSVKDYQSMYYVDLGDEAEELKSFPLPEDLKKPGKAIDDVAEFVDTLYVLDDLVLPKYLYVFGIKKHDLKHVIDLEVHGTYECYFRIQINNKYIVTLSSTVGDGGSGSHLSFYSRDNIKYISGLILFQSSGIYDYFEKKRNPMFKDILLVENYLIVSAGDGGVITLNLEDENVLKELGIIDDINEEYCNLSERFKDKYLSDPYFGDAQGVQELYKENERVKAAMVTVFDRGEYRPEILYIE